jgi:hypothetical protein
VSIYSHDETNDGGGAGVGLISGGECSAGLGIDCDIMNDQMSTTSQLFVFEGDWATGKNVSASQNNTGTLT